MAIITWKWWGNLVRLLFGSFCYEPKRCWLYKRGFLRGSAKNTSLFWFKFTSSWVFYIFVCSTARDALVRDHCFDLGLLFGFHKAESEAGTFETFARDTNVDSTATRDRSSYLKEDPEKAKIPTTQDAAEDIPENGCLFGHAHSFSLLAFLQTTTSDSFKLASLSVVAAMVSVY